MRLRSALVKALSKFVVTSDFGGFRDEFIQHFFPSKIWNQMQREPSVDPSEEMIVDTVRSLLGPS